MKNESKKMLDRRSNVPLHTQMINSLRRDILDGKFALNEALPTHQDLSTQFGLETESIQIVFETLKKEKLIRFDGSAYRCIFKTIPTFFFDKISDFRHIIESRGLEYQVVDFDITVKDDDKQTSWIHLHRTYYGDDQCLIVADSRFCADVFPMLLHKSTNDTRPYTEYFIENKVKKFTSSLRVSLATLPNILAEEMSQPKDSTCSMTEYRVIQKDRLILESTVYMLGLGFRFNFLTKSNDE